MPATLDVNILGPPLTAEQAEQIYRQGKEAVVFALLRLAMMLAEQQQQTQAAPSPPPPRRACARPIGSRPRRNAR